MSDVKQFSRRHVTAEAHFASQQAKEAKVQDWRDTMEQNAIERAQRSPAQQLALLDTRLGKGVGAKKERARLALEIESVTRGKVKKTKKGGKK